MPQPKYSLIYSSFMGEDVAHKIEGGWISKASHRFYPDADVKAWMDLPPPPGSIGGEDRWRAHSP